MLGLFERSPSILPVVGAPDVRSHICTVPPRCALISNPAELSPPSTVVIHCTGLVGPSSLMRGAKPLSVYCTKSDGSMSQDQMCADYGGLRPARYRCTCLHRQKRGMRRLGPGRRSHPDRDCSKLNPQEGKMALGVNTWCPSSACSTPLSICHTRSTPLQTQQETRQTTRCNKGGDRNDEEAWIRFKETRKRIEERRARLERRGVGAEERQRTKNLAAVHTHLRTEFVPVVPANSHG